MNSSAKDLEKLDKIHYEAIRIIIGATKKSPQMKIQNEVNLETPSNRHNYFALCQIYVLFKELSWVYCTL